MIAHLVVGAAWVLAPAEEELVPGEPVALEIAAEDGAFGDHGPSRELTCTIEADSAVYLHARSVGTLDAEGAPAAPFLYVETADGEELGAERGLLFYMQRTALQGFRGLLEKRFGPPEE